LYHAANGIFVPWLVMHVWESNSEMALGALGFALFAWSAELSRRKLPVINNALMKVWGKTAHPHEYHSINSGTWILTAMFTLALLFDRPIALIGVVVCGFGDPAAAFFGRNWGKRHIRKGRTLEGSGAFVIVAAAVTLGLLALYLPQVNFGQALVVSFAAAIVGALVELFSPVDDNLSIPIASGAAGWATLMLLGVDVAPGFLFTV